jgi:hypothetical protein
MAEHLNETRLKQIGLAMASPETRKRVWAAASEARQKAFELYRENKKRLEKAAKREAKAKAEAR